MPSNSEIEVNESVVLPEKIEVNVDNNSLIDYFEQQKQLELEEKKQQELIEKETQEKLLLEESKTLEQQQQYDEELLTTLKDIKQSNTLIYQEMLKSNEFLQYSNNQSYFFIVSFGVILFLILIYKTIIKFTY